MIDGVATAAKALEKVEDINRALVKVKEGLHSVKVSQFDATQVQREIEGELFDKWHEGCEVRDILAVMINIKKVLQILRNESTTLSDIAISTP